MKDPVVGGAKGLPIRQALAYSADTNAIINVVREGVPLPATGIVPAGIPGSGLVDAAVPLRSQQGQGARGPDRHGPDAELLD